MIATAPRTGELMVTTSRAHVEAVAARYGLGVVAAGPYLYAVRQVALLDAPIVYRCVVAS